MMMMQCTEAELHRMWVLHEWAFLTSVSESTHGGCKYIDAHVPIVPFPSSIPDNGPSSSHLFSHYTWPNSFRPCLDIKAHFYYPCHRYTFFSPFSSFLLIYFILSLRMKKKKNTYKLVFESLFL